MLFDYHLRPMTEDDRELLRMIFRSSWDRALALAPLPKESKELVLNQQFELQHESYQRQYPYADYSLLYVGEEAAGRIYVDRGPERFVLIDITILPQFRRKGLGSQVMREVLEEAQLAHKPVTLHVEHWNPEARRLYHRLGFSEVQDTGTHWKMQWNPSN